jgi:hypothetical protein
VTNIEELDAFLRDKKKLDIRWIQFRIMRRLLKEDKFYAARKLHDSHINDDESL